LYDTVQRHQITVDVVEDFDRRRLRTQEVERGTAGKDFDMQSCGGNSGIPDQTIATVLTIV